MWYLIVSIPDLCTLTYYDNIQANRSFVIYETNLNLKDFADLLALVCDVYCDFVTIPFGILGQVWCLIVSILDPCCLIYFYQSELCQAELVVVSIKNLM